MGLPAALRFQPTKRPQNAVQKQAQKIAQAKAAAINASLATSATTAPSSTAPDAKEQSQRPSAKTTIADWIGDADDDEAELFGGEKRRKGGRKKRKKNKQEASVAQDWDDIYDPTRPNNYEEYKHSDEKIREVREWKDRLYAHRMARRNDLSDSEDEDRRPQMSSEKNRWLKEPELTSSTDKFAPPSMSFAPPPIDQEPPPSSADVLNDTAGEGAYEEQYQPPPPPPMEVPDDASGEDAYARRMRLSQLQSGIPAAPLTEPPPPPPPPEEPVPSQNLNFQRSAIDASSTVARAPVRYNLPPAPAELPKSEEELEAALQEDAEQQDDSAKDVPRSSRPGQRGFAERLMSKYGWTKGSGLGANSSGIINPLRVQVEKQKKKPDSEGGGFVGPGGRGKIIGGKKKGGEEDHGKFGPMSDVVILKDMLNGMDIDHELGEGNLMQEIGEECGEKVCLFLEPKLRVEVVADIACSTEESNESTSIVMESQMQLCSLNSRTNCLHFEYVPKSTDRIDIPLTES